MNNPVSRVITVTTVIDGSDGEDARYIYLCGTARDIDSSILVTLPRIVRINGDDATLPSGRGLLLVTINRQTLAVVDNIVYDTYGEAVGESGKKGITDLIAKLGTLDSSVFVSLTSSDAIGWSSALISKLQDFGLDEIPYNGTGRYPFAFLGYLGLGKGYALLQMHNTGSYDHVAEIGAYVVDGTFVSSKDGAKGDSAIQLTLDNQHEDFLYSDSGLVSPMGGATSPIHLYDGQTEKTDDVTIQVYDDNTNTWGASTGANASAAASVTQSSGTATLSVTALRADSVKVRVRAKYPNDSTGKFYYAEFTANKTSQDKYDLVVSPSSIAYNHASYNTKRIMVYANRTNLNNATTQADISTSSDSGTLRLFATYNGSTVQITNTVTDGDKTKHYLDVTDEMAAANDGIYLELRKYSGTSFAVVDYETVEIAKVANGEAGTRYQRIYKSTNSATYTGTTPSGDSPEGWSAVPTVINQQARYRYLSERYSNDGGATWGDWSTPQIDAYLAEDGRSIKINGQFTKAQVTARTGATEPTSDDIVRYLNYTYPNAADYDGYLYTENGHLWLFNGTTWEDVGQIQGPKGDNGKDGWMITANPANVIITQDMTTASKFSTAEVSFTAKRGNIIATISSLGTPSSSEFDVAKKSDTGDDAKKVVVSRPKMHTPSGATSAEYYTEGSFQVVVNVADPYTLANVAFTVTVPCYANLLGAWRQTIDEDVETIAAEKVAYIYDPDNPNQVVKQSTFGNYVRSSAANISRLVKENVNTLFFQQNKSFEYLNTQYVHLNKGKYIFCAYVNLGSLPTGSYNWSFAGHGNTDTSDDEIIENITINTEGDYYFLFEDSVQSGSGEVLEIYVKDITASSSEIKQTAENIEFKVKNDYASAGISISVDGNVSKIVLDASKIQINNGTTTAAMFENGKIKADYIDAKVIKAGSVSGNEFTFASGTVLKDLTVRGTVYAENGEFTGKITATSGSITGDLVLGDEQKAHFKLQPSVSYGTNKAAKIAGYDTSGTEVISLQFYDSENHLDPQLRLGESWFGEKRGQIRCQANGNLSTIDYLVAEGNAHAEFYEDYKLNGVQFVNKIRIGVDNGDVTLRATNYEESKSAWPLSNQNAIQHAPFGKVYGVTLSSLQTMLINRDSYGSQVVVFVARNDTI